MHGARFAGFGLLQGRPHRGTLTTLLCVLVVGCGGEQAAPALSPAGAAERVAVTEAPSLGRAERAYQEGQYVRSWEVLARLAEGDRQSRRGRLLAADLRLACGEYAAVAEELDGLPPGDLDAAPRRALALQRLGEPERGLAELRAAADHPRAFRVWLLQGELLLELGRRQEAEPAFLRVIGAYNDDLIQDTDGLGMAWVGRAAHLLRSPHDANDAFDLSEQAQPGLTETLLYRAELFLEKYDPGHAEEVLTELLARNPNHPRGLVLLAQVKLAQALDFDAANELAERALETNPRLAEAYFLLAGLELRDMALAEADAWLQRGLTTNPRDLQLLSMKGAVRFLADDTEGFAAVKTNVLRLNPEFTGFFQVVGEYAEWEHRYEEIVRLMQEAVAIDDQDANAHAALGINLIRSGEDAAGLLSLQRAFAKDPFNVRVLNTRNLYQEVIPREYASAPHGVFRIRYPVAEQRLLERYLPPLLDRAWATMVKEYGFTPEVPVGVEIYAEREHFAIRTSGLPTTGIQGVCFGRTLASMSPHAEPFNLGMTLWHELAHVFHIQLSKSHVPRWFTEGLAEYETIVARGEWRRERDPDLYEALRDARLPSVGNMNRAFTHAESLQDVATAYYASSQIVVMLGEQHGRESLRKMLSLWAQGLRTEDVVQQALGMSTADLDAAFKQFSERRLVRYTRQFVPRQRVGKGSVIRARAKQEPKSADAQTDLARWAVAEGNQPAAVAALQRALRLDPTHVEARWLSARVAAKEEPQTARRLLTELVKSGQDGYAVQMALAELSEPPVAMAHLERAHQFDPSQSEPLFALASAATKAGDKAGERAALEKLAQLEEHSPHVFRRLLRALVGVGDFKRAVQVGDAAVFADLDGMETHWLLAQALEGTGDASRARFEFDSALLCAGRTALKEQVHRDYARFLAEQGQAREAKRQLEQADALQAGGSKTSAPADP